MSNTNPLHSASGIGSAPIPDSHNDSDVGETITRANYREIGAGVQGQRKATSIHLIPDSVLLEIFDFCRKNRRCSAAFISESRPAAILEWKFVHVCQRWRYLILASPSRLDLKLVCSPGTPVRKTLGSLAAFPIIVNYDRVAPKDEDNVIAALEHPDRVRRIGLSGLTRTLWEKLDAAMQEPFPSLTHLSLTGPKDKDERALALPRKLLGAGALRLQELYLEGMSYPGLPQFLLSAPELVNLRFTKIPSTCYVSPEDMLTGLAGLPRLESLEIEFQSSTLSNILSDQRLMTPTTPAVHLPSLKLFIFKGFSEYLEGLVAQIDAPQVTKFNIEYFSQSTYQVPQLARFLVRSEYLKSPELSGVKVQFMPWTHICFTGSRSSSESINLTFKFNTSGMVRGVLHSVQLFQQISASISSIAHLILVGPAPAFSQPEKPFGTSSGFAEILFGEANCRQTLSGRPLLELSGVKDSIDDIDWIEFLRVFTGVESLFLRGELSEEIIQALELVSGDMVTTVLPALHTLEFCRKRPTVSVNRFVSVRQNAGRPVTIIYPD